MDLQEYLKQDFETRKRKHSDFSLRDYAKIVNIPPGRLSEIMSRKREISYKMAQTIIAQLKIEPSLSSKFLSEVVTFKVSQLKGNNLNDSFTKLSRNQFDFISEWQHFAILSLFETTHDKKVISIKWASERLGLINETAERSFETLVNLGLIKKEKDGGYYLCDKNNLATNTDIPDDAIKLFHKNTIGLALNSIDNVDVEDRDISSITMAIDKNKLPVAKKMIKDFRRKLMVYLEDGEKDEVYNLNIQLFPLSNLDSNKNSEAV